MTSTVNKLRAGDYYAVCDVCGIKFWASEMSIRWDGLFVDRDCNDPYHGGDKVKIIKEDRTVPIARSRTFADGDNELETTPMTVAKSEYWYVVD